MKPSSKICRIGFIGLAGAAALSASIGEAAAAGRFAGAPAFFPARPGMARPAHAPQTGPVGSGLDARQHRRLSPASFAYGLPYGYDWSGPAPYYGSNADADVRGPLIVPAFFVPPGGVPYPNCNAPRIIHVGAHKQTPHLPRVVYGTPSACPN
jgi:hypothetical protein